jgi:hypothetical protein
VVCEFSKAKLIVTFDFFREVFVFRRENDDKHEAATEYSKASCCRIPIHKRHCGRLNFHPRHEEVDQLHHISLSHEARNISPGNVHPAKSQRRSVCQNPSGTGDSAPSLRHLVGHSSLTAGVEVFVLKRPDPARDYHPDSLEQGNINVLHAMAQTLDGINNRNVRTLRIGSFDQIFE